MRSIQNSCHASIDIEIWLKHNINMNRLDPVKRVKVIAALVEGNSVRAVSRMTGIARNTITSMLVDLGAACAEYQDKVLRSLPCRRIPNQGNLRKAGSQAPQYVPRGAPEPHHADAHAEV